MQINKQSEIRNQFHDTNNELTFIDYMIEKKYKQAFDLCCAVFNVYDTNLFIQDILYYFYPNIRKEQARYNIFVQTSTSDDFQIFDKLIMNIHDKFETLSNIIFD